MKANKRSGTYPELVLSKLLRKRITKNTLPGSPDFVYRSQKLAVFVHGCFWHCCPTCNLPPPRTHADFWKRKFERNIERDQLNRTELESMDWRVIEVWEHEVNEHPTEAAKRIRAIAVRRGRTATRK